MLNINTHTNSEYEEELKNLKDRILKMASKVEQMISSSVKSLITRDIHLAEQTIVFDHSVNNDEVELDKCCLQILAKRQPMASDLRFVTIALKMVTDLERISDLAVNICKRTLKINNFPQGQFEKTIEGMGGQVQLMLRESIESFIDNNAAQAKSLMLLDNKIDEYYHQLMRETIKMMRQDEALVKPLLNIQSAAKWLERMGDHCTNLGELVVFMVRGKDIRHTRRKLI